LTIFQKFTDIKFETLSIMCVSLRNRYTLLGIQRAWSFWWFCPLFNAWFPHLFPYCWESHGWHSGWRALLECGRLWSWVQRQ